MPASSSFKHRIKEQEDYIRDWTAHREEIARLVFCSFFRNGDWREVAQQLNDKEEENLGLGPSTHITARDFKSSS